MDSSPDPRWLEGDDGFAWLYTADGTAWIRTSEGQAWLRSEAGERFAERCAQAGWNEYFSGNAREPAEWMLTPQTAPRIGTRVRLIGDWETLRGARFKAGELAIVTELRLMQVGGVMLTLRTPDGREVKALSASEYTLA